MDSLVRLGREPQRLKRVLQIHRAPRLSADTIDWQILSRRFHELTTRRTVALEIGASTPATSVELAASCEKLFGVELYPCRIPAEKPAPNIKYLAGDWQCLSDILEPESIDLAVAFHVIEHVPDDLRALDQLHTVIRGGGTAIIITPNRLRLTRQLAEIFGPPRTFPWWEHQREYTEPDLSRLLTASRFDKFTIQPPVFGLLGGRLFAYSTVVPRRLRSLANYWMVEVTK